MQLNEPYLYYYLTFALIMLFFSLVFIPKRKIQKLFWFGMLWGSILDFIVEHIYVFFHLTKYQYMEPFNIGALPLWTVLAWTPAIMLFIYLFPQHKAAYLYWVYLTMWSTFITFVAVILNHLRLLIFINGGPWIWFVGGFIFLHLMSKYHQNLEASSKDS
ncbi:MAG TPA: hypothetical protein VEC37_07920 [Bacillota bacterium]|nr:hypothetical protein [Bacillota bacterium]